MKSPCIIRKWNGDELGKAVATIFPPLLARLTVWTGYLFVESDRHASHELLDRLVEDDPLILHLQDGRAGQFRVTARSPVTGEYAIEGTSPLELG
jgi:hypothetical protein